MLLANNLIPVVHVGDSPRKMPNSSFEFVPAPERRSNPIEPSIGPAGRLVLLNGELKRGRHGGDKTDVGVSLLRHERVGVAAAAAVGEEMREGRVKKGMGSKTALLPPGVGESSHLAVRSGWYLGEEKILGRKKLQRSENNIAPNHKIY